MVQESNAGHLAEKTFRAYTNEQSAAYAEYRYGYHPNLYQRIVDYHVTNGGKLDTVVDVGCGPGTATKIIATFFANAIGIDPSEAMITTARKQGGVSDNGEAIRYECSSAEDLGADQGLVVDGEVDLITAATAAHWFDMTKFWPRAAQLLKPGGTVAIWVGNHEKCHSSMPNAEKINAALLEIEEKDLAPFMEPGNIMVRDLYADMLLPWTLSTNAVDEFDQSTFFRKEWGTPGNDDTETEGQEFFLNGQTLVTMDMVEKGMATASPVTRWRLANPDKVGTEQDIARMYRRIIEQGLHEAGVAKGQEFAKGNTTGVLLMIKKKT